MLLTLSMKYSSDNSGHGFDHAYVNVVIVRTLKAVFPGQSVCLNVYCAYVIDRCVGSIKAESLVRESFRISMPIGHLKNAMLLTLLQDNIRAIKA